LSRSLATAASRAWRASSWTRIRKSRSVSSGADDSFARLLLYSSIDCDCATHCVKSFSQVA
jgi:hypothetical protein